MRVQRAGSLVLVACLAACSGTDELGEPSAGGAGGTSGSAGSSASGAGGVPGAGTSSGAAGAGASSGGASSGAGGRAGASSGGRSGAGGKGGSGASGDGGRAGTAESGRGGAGTSGDAGSGGAGDACDEPGIVVDGRRLLLDCEPFHLKGVCWNPVRKGENHPAGLDFAGAVAGDAALMAAIGVNVVRTYEPITSTGVLDALYAAGIYVLNSVYPYGGDPVSVVTGRVDMVKDHPAILGWVLGNEWNYNGLYVDLSHADSLARLNEAAALVRAADTSHPIVSVYGEVPSEETLDAMPEIDIWGINAYRGISFGDLFSVWAARSEKPMFLSEYGADAYNANEDAYDPESQAMATAALTQELVDHAVAFGTDGVTLGGTLFEWSDEWWKDQGGSLDAQDVGGIAPGGGPYPDMTFNEEWWGIVDIDREPRAAYDALGAVFAGL
jgi:hypothetical protein